MDPISYLISRAEKFEEDGDYESSERLWTIVLLMQEKNWGTDSPKLIDTLYNFGMLCFALDNYSKAEKLLLRCLEIERKHYPPEHPSITDTVNALTSIHLEKYFNKAHKRALSA